MQAAPKEKGCPGRNTGRKKTMDITELEDVYSENDKYLIREYQKHGTDDFLVAGLGDKTFRINIRWGRIRRKLPSAALWRHCLILKYGKKESTCVRGNRC